MQKNWHARSAWGKLEWIHPKFATEHPHNGYFHHRTHANRQKRSYRTHAAMPNGISSAKCRTAWDHSLILRHKADRRERMIPSGYVCRGWHVASGRGYWFLLLHNAAKLSRYSPDVGVLIIIINLEEPQFGRGGWLWCTIGSTTGNCAAAAENTSILCSRLSTRVSRTFCVFMQGHI